ncbi:M48 family metalloprotease [Neptunicella marina]|uniref:Putative beta-barrel assembly-enhancing protease n=1 Tax=Neptunicella marina TaxID=2125989 RepID=A0A8J6IXV8_9ALTE|nr:M48 family metalloprotease [Neptunicella marina]MBC3767352.1 M48 family metallopeptidase [Neptunicella marina]
MQRLLVLLLALSFSVSAAQSININNKKNDLPEIGVVASHVMSIEREQAIGDIYMRQLRAQAPIVNDPLLEEYIQDIGNKLVAQADNVKFPFQFFLLNSPDINAFAFFGGHIAVHTGLILNASNESELAAVLSHEITHITQRHMARKIEASQASSPLQMASLLGGLLVAMANPEAGIAAISASSAAAQQSSINYTRSNENEADRLGMKVLANAGYDVNAAADFFGKLAAQYRFVSKPPAFLLTHPVPESRIADAKARAHLYAQHHPTPSLNFALAKARIVARYGTNKNNSQVYFDDLSELPDAISQAAAAYGKTLMLFEQQKYQQAQIMLAPLIKADPTNLFYMDTQTDIFLEQQQYQQAVDMLQPQLAKMPRNRVLSLNMANALFKLKQFAKGEQLIKDYLLVNPEHTLSYQLLIDAYTENQQKLELHQARAEYFALLSIYPKAIDELQTAYNFTNDNTLAKQRIRARIDQFRDADKKLRSM